MPLNKSFPKGTEVQRSKSAAEFTTERQYARSGYEVEGNGAERPGTPKSEIDEPSRTLGDDEGRGVPNSVFVGRQKPHALELQDPREAFNPHKLSVPPTGPSRASNSVQQAFIGQDTNVQKLQPVSNGTKLQKQKAQKHALSAFDETTSIGSSFLNSNEFDENYTMIHRPSMPSTKDLDNFDNSMPQQLKYEPGEGAEDNLDPERMARAIGGVHWRDEVVKEKEYQKHRSGITSGEIRDESRSRHFKSFRENSTQRISSGANKQIETPSRTRSTPPHASLPAPVPHNPTKSVGFVSSTEFMGGNQDSPAFHSAEMARDDSIDMASAQTSGVHPMSQSMAIHQKSQPVRDDPKSRFRPSNVGISAHASRFPKMIGHRSQAMEQDEKVSAPDSDMQDSSEDEIVTTSHRTPEAKNPFEQPETVAASGTKRSFDESNKLDYDDGVLMTMSLPELQAQQFTQNPRDDHKEPVRDSHGNEMSLHQILENLSKMTPEAQGQVFRKQTDVEWAQSGQWFIDKFQEDLKQLMEVRLERRKLAMKFEDRIRRQQREVEHYQAGVQQELNELQKGGDGLLRDRKASGGSRCATPMKASRS